MTIQIGPVALRDGLIWEDEFRYSGIVQEVKTTLGGTPQIYSASYLGPRPITLVGLEDQGWQTYAALKELQSISKTLDGQFVLTLGVRTFTVGFRHHEPPVIEATPLIARSTYSDDDFFQISIKLMAYLT